MTAQRIFKPGQKTPGMYMEWHFESHSLRCMQARHTMYVWLHLLKSFALSFAGAACSGNILSSSISLILPGMTTVLGQVWGAEQVPCGVGRVLNGMDDLRVKSKFAKAPGKGAGSARFFLPENICLAFAYEIIICSSLYRRPFLSKERLQIGGSVCLYRWKERCSRFSRARPPLVQGPVRPGASSSDSRGPIEALVHCTILTEDL
jgi:hypothetical protein